MQWYFTPLTVPLIIGTAIIVWAVTVAWQRRSTPGALYLLLGASTLVFYVVGYALEIGSASLEQLRFFLKMEYIGVTIPPVMLFALVLTYANMQRLLTRTNLFFMMLIPLATIAFAWTNDSHELIWRNLTYTRVLGMSIAEFERGAWYYVASAYYYILMLAGIVILIIALRKATGVYRRQIITMLIGMLIPLPIYAIYLSGMIPVNLDPNPFSYTITSAIFAWGLFSYQLFDMMPVAREVVLSSMSDAVIVLDMQHRVVELNPPAQMLAGMTAEVAIGKHAAVVFAPWNQQLDHFRDKFDTHEETHIDVEGSRRTYDIRISSLRTRSGAQTGRVVVMRDITERVEAEAALQQSYDRLTALRHVDQEMAQKLDVSHVTMIALDAAMRISGADSALLGFTEDRGTRIVKVVGGYPTDMIGQIVENTNTGPNLHNSPELEVTDSARPGAKTARITVPLLSQTRLVGVMRLETDHPARFSPQVIESIKLLAGHVATFVDNARMYQERERLVADLEAYARTVAHDLQNPISVMSGFASMMLELDDRITPAQRRDYLERMMRGSRRADRIIKSLLLLASARSADITIKVVDMAVILKDVEERFAADIEQRGATLSMPADWPSVLAYAPWLEEIWANYIGNALKYGGEPPRVELGHDAPQAGLVRFWVRDNGPGLSAEQAARLFKPFVRLEQHHELEGTGLGLSIVHRIAEQLGGEVGIASTEGIGSLFYFTLPAAPSGQSAPMAVETAS